MFWKYNQKKIVRFSSYSISTSLVEKLFCRFARLWTFFVPFFFYNRTAQCRHIGISLTWLILVLESKNHAIRNHLYSTRVLQADHRRPCKEACRIISELTWASTSILFYQCIRHGKLDFEIKCCGGPLFCTPSPIAFHWKFKIFHPADDASRY